MTTDPALQAPRTIPLKEFVERGYLQELNRQFLHPLGLSLAVRTYDDGSMQLGGIWDCRDDPEGIVPIEPPDATKTRAIALERARRMETQIARALAPLGNRT